MSEDKVKKIRLLAIACYATIIGMFISIALNKDKNEYVNFHVRQSMGIYAIFILSMITMLTSATLALIVYFLFVFLWVMGLVAALQNSMKPIPLLGDKFQELFKKLI